MDAADVRLDSLEERIVFWAIVGTWGFFALGALYLLAPALGWCLAALALARHVGIGKTYPVRRVPPGVAVWWLSMAAMLVALVVAHLQYDLGTGTLIKSSIGWAKGWALMAVFPWVGAMLRIKASVIYRATNILAAQTLALIPLFVAAALLHVPHPLFISPLQAVGGPGPEFFAVSLYSIDDTNGMLRWQFFAPWAPAAAFVANISFIFALYDRRRLWKVVGIASSVAVCVLSQSRLGLIVFPGVLLLGYLLGNLTRPAMVGAVAAIFTAGVLWLPQLSRVLTSLSEGFNGARAASTRVRALLRAIALQRWRDEAPVFGHGIVERGPHLVEHMPIGSHHSWFGLLFVKGAVGFGSLAIPLAWTLVEMILKAQRDRVARSALGVAIVITFYTFGENLEILAYLFWPGLIVIGIAMRRRLVSPFAPFMVGPRPEPAGDWRFAT